MTKADSLATDQGCYFDEDEASKVVQFANKYITPQFVAVHSVNLFVGIVSEANLQAT